MSKSKIVMVLAILLVVGYFLPWMSMIINVSGFDFTRIAWSAGDNGGQMVVAIMLTLIPVLGILTCILGATGKAHGLAAFFAGLMFWLLVLFGYLGSRDRPDMQGGELLSVVGIGGWICAAASLLLLLFAFTKSDSKLRAAMR
jgi:hypothetical protein